MTEMRTRLGVLAVVALTSACGSQTVVDGSQGGGGSATSSSSGSTNSTGGGASSSGAGGFGIGGSGTGMPAWENDCAMTGIVVSGPVGPDVLLDRACPNDDWAQSHYDGANAYDVAAGVVGNLELSACDASGDQRISFFASVNGVGPATILDAQYQVAPSESYTMSSGVMETTNDAQQGQVLEGNYQGTFNPDQNDGPPIQLGGDIRACILPTLARP